MNYASYAAINQNTDKEDESCEKLVIAKIRASAGVFYGVCAGASEVEIVDACLTKSGCKVKINVLVDLSACGGTFFMRIYN